MIDLLGFYFHKVVKQLNTFIHKKKTSVRKGSCFAIEDA